MKPERAKELLPVIQAFAAGRPTQWRFKNECGWRDTTPTAGLAFEDDCDYRIKPEPKLRPWTNKEVPVGAQIRYKGNLHSTRFLIACNSEHGLAGAGTRWPYEQLLHMMEYSTDGGKTWLPCGVEE